MLSLHTQRNILLQYLHMQNLSSAATLLSKTNRPSMCASCSQERRLRFVKSRIQAHSTFIMDLELVEGLYLLSLGRQRPPA